MQFLVNSNFNFLGKRKTARIFSIALILIGVGSLIIQGGPKLGIDFTGGTSLRLQFEKGVSIGEVSVSSTDADWRRHSNYLADPDTRQLDDAFQQRGGLADVAVRRGANRCYAPGSSGPAVSSVGPGVSRSGPGLARGSTPPVRCILRTDRHGKVDVRGLVAQ